MISERLSLHHVQEQYMNLYQNLFLPSVIYANCNRAVYRKHILSVENLKKRKGKKGLNKWLGTYNRHLCSSGQVFRKGLPKEIPKVKYEETFNVRGFLLKVDTMMDIKSRNIKGTELFIFSASL